MLGLLRCVQTLFSIDQSRICWAQDSLSEISDASVRHARLMNNFSWIISPLADWPLTPTPVCSSEVIASRSRRWIRVQVLSVGSCLGLMLGHTIALERKHRYRTLVELGLSHPVIMTGNVNQSPEKCINPWCESILLRYERGYLGRR